MSRTDYDVIVVGGGISGLGTAHMCRRAGHRTLLLEQSERLGGCINTHDFGAETHGFWTELGAHTCFNSYGHLLSILEDLGLLPSLIAKQRVSYRFLASGKLTSVTSQLNFLELFWSLPRLLWTPKAERSVAEYYARVAGQGNYDRVLSAAFDAVICQPADEFPADALFRRKPRRKDVARSFTTASGLSAIVRAIGDQQGLDVNLGRQVLAVDTAADGLGVTLADQRSLSARNILVAVPPDRAARLLAPAFPRLADRLRKLEMAEVETLSLAVERSQTPLAPMAGIIARDQAFYSMVSRDPVTDPRFRGFTFHFRPDSHNPRQQLSRALEVLKLEETQIAASTSTRSRLPALRKGHAALVSSLDRELAGSRLGLTGNYFFGVSIEDCLTRSDSECRRLGLL